MVVVVVVGGGCWHQCTVREPDRSSTQRTHQQMADGSARGKGNEGSEGGFGDWCCLQAWAGLGG